MSLHCTILSIAYLFTWLDDGASWREGSENQDSVLVGAWLHQITHISWRYTWRARGATGKRCVNESLGGDACRLMG